MMIVYWIFLTIAWNIAVYSLLSLLLLFIERHLKKTGLEDQVTHSFAMRFFFPWLFPTMRLGDYIARRGRLAMVVRKRGRFDAFLSNLVPLAYALAGILLIACIFTKGAVSDIISAVASASLNWGIFLYYYLKKDDDRRWGWDEPAPDPDGPGGNARLLPRNETHLV